MGQKVREVNRRQQSVDLAFRRILWAAPSATKFNLAGPVLPVRLARRSDLRVARFPCITDARLRAARGGKPARSATIEPGQRAPASPSQRRNVLRKKREPERKHPEAKHWQDA